MIHEILPVGMLACNCSIFGDETTREGIVIDPGDNIPQILGVLKRHGLSLKAIVITHAHIDHIGGAAALKAATGAPVYMNENDELQYQHLDMQASWLGVETPERTAIDVHAREGDKLSAGVTDFSRAPNAGAYAGKHFPLDPIREKSDRRRHAVSRQHRPHGSPRRRLPADPAVNSR